jgi:hypothetical protein
MRHLHCGGEGVPMATIIHGETFVKSCGYWPTFHDATVLRLVPDRDGVAGLDNSQNYSSSRNRFRSCLPITQGRTQG